MSVSKVTSKALSPLWVINVADHGLNILIEVILFE